MSSAKLLHSIADENPDLQKQMGCMSGIFQMFDREITHKRVPSSCLGALQLDNGPGRDFTRKQDTDNEKQRGVSTESKSRAYFSSSCSSSSSSSSSQDPPNYQLNISNVDNKLRNAGKSKTRPPGVVAKLMGLEQLPDSASQKENSFTKKPSRTMEVKQILDAIQSNLLSEDKVSNFLSPKKAESCRNPYWSLPIVIIKPATIVERDGLLCSSSVIAVSPFLNLQKFKENDSNGGRNSRKAKNQSPPRKSINNDRKSTRSIVQQLSKRQSRSSNSVKKSGYLSSKLQKKKLELPLTSSNSKMSEFKHNVSCLKMEGELVSSVQPCKELSLQLRDDDKPRLEHATRAAEHPSPVSVLDLSEYTDDESPPVKQEPQSIKEISKHRSSNHYNVKVGENGGEPPLMNHQKLLYINHLVQNLINLNPGHDEQQTDYLASLCENCMNPDHKYIAEILVISGLLLTDLSSDCLPFKLHRPSGHPINPELFYVLEKTKTCLKPKKKKIHRRLIFDTVNEILLKKFAFAGIVTVDTSRVRPKIVAWTARKLLKEVCFEIDMLKAKQKPIDNIVSERLDDCCHGEVYGMVLGIERLIFKDLVCEVLIGASGGAEARPNIHRRLFFE